MDSTIVWEYESSGKSTTELFYMLVGGYPFAEALVELAKFVADPRIPIFADEEGHVELEAKDRVFVECTECHSNLSSSVSQVKFSMDAPLSEDFVGQRENPGFTICHHRVRDLIVSRGFTGGVFLNSERSENAPDSSRDYCTWQALTPIERVRKRVLTTCPQCKKKGTYVCEKCGQLRRTCEACGFDAEFKSTAIRSPKYLCNPIDLKNWSGEDILKNSDGLIVTGEIV
ncbi:MAG: hypothetical protein SFV81_05280 [Pirellulaceae bacterium]|nr:hypothetical protein [Pirellulaceae bacterium]